MLAAVPGVTTVSGVRADKARIFGATESVAGIDPVTIAKVYRFAWKDGSDAVLAHLGDGAILDTTYAKHHHLSIGDPITIETSASVKRTFHVRATYHPKFQAVLEGVLISRAAFDRTFPNPRQHVHVRQYVDGREPAHYPGADPRVRSLHGRDRRHEGVLDHHPDRRAQAGARRVLRVPRPVGHRQPVRNGQHLVLSVFERTREIGMLRAVGMSRRKVRRMIRHESIITALIGAALGSLSASSWPGS